MAAMADAIDVKCPTCGHLTQVPADSVGRQARCQCGFTFVISDGELFDLIEDAFEEDAEAPATGVVAEGARELDGPRLVEEDDAVHSTYHPGSAGNASPGFPAESPTAERPDDDPVVLPEIDRLLDPDEEVLYSETPPLTAVQVRIGVWLVVLGAPLSLLAVSSVAAGEGGGACVAITGLGILGSVLVVKYLGWRTRFYMITDQRTVVHEGLLLKRISLVPHHAVLTISVETGVVERWSETRSVRLRTATAGLGGGGLLLANSTQADRVVSLLGQLMMNRESPW